MGRLPTNTLSTFKLPLHTPNGGRRNQRSSYKHIQTIELSKRQIKANTNWKEVCSLSELCALTLLTI